MSKRATLLLIVILTVSSLIMAKPANAQSIPTPSVPEFTVKYTNHPYYVPSINYTNPYTGEAMTYGGFYVDSKSIEVTIKNQKFDYPSYHLFYNARLKFHFTEKWDERFPIVQYLNSSGNGTAQYIAESAPRQSNTEFTVISYYLSSGQFANAQLDFQVEALVGYDSARLGVEGHTQSAIAYYATSNWSNTQTITIGGIPPSITLLSPENKTYNIMDIPLSFAVDNQTSWIGYSLDNEANVTISGNTTLAELPEGHHELIVHANDTYGNMGSSEKINFTIAKQPEPFTTLVIAVLIVSVPLVGAGLLVYRIKFKKPAKNQSPSEQHKG